MQRNFILTDVMKTGNHTELEEFVSMHSLKDQQFDTTGEYYTLHKFDLDSYDRKFAVIDVRQDNGRIKDNEEFHLELRRRCDLLASQGFVFIKSTPWESLDNILSNQFYHLTVGNIGFCHPIIDIEHVKWTGGTSWFWFYMYRKHIDKSYNFDHTQKNYDFLYLNKRPRVHRKTLFDRMRPLLADSLYTNWDEGIKLNREYELPWAKNYPRSGLDQDIFEKPYNHTKYSIVSETNDSNNEIFITEKIWKPIIAQHIFVVHGNYLYLQKLREMGFKTFGAYFDESYDIERNRNNRVEKIFATCENLKSKNWKDIYLQTQALRRHNLKTFFDKEKLSLEINKTLELFLEFADSR